MARVAIIGIGLPGSGKTTKLKKLARQRGAVYICVDDIRAELTGCPGDQSVNAQAWAIAYRRIHQALDGIGSVVVDATNAKLIDRLRLIQHCRAKADVVEGLWFRASLNVCLQRNRRRDETTRVPERSIRRMAEWLQADPPGPDEGFDSFRVIWTNPR